MKKLILLIKYNLYNGKKLTLSLDFVYPLIMYAFLLIILLLLIKWFSMIKLIMIKFSNVLEQNYEFYKYIIVMK